MKKEIGRLSIVEAALSPSELLQELAAELGDHSVVAGYDLDRLAASGGWDLVAGRIVRRAATRMASSELLRRTIPALRLAAEFCPGKQSRYEDIRTLERIIDHEVSSGEAEAWLDSSPFEPVQAMAGWMLYDGAAAACGDPVENVGFAARELVRSAAASVPSEKSLFVARAIVEALRTELEREPSAAAA